MNTKLGQGAQPSQDPSPPTRRVVAVVELLAERAPTPLALAEICRELGISRSTGHAILHTLCACAWTMRDPVSGRYAIGPGLPTPSPAASGIRILREPLRQLSTAIGMAVCVSEVRDGSIAVVDAAAPGTAQPPVPAGVRLPFVGPFGREFVAWAPASLQTQWLDAAGAVNDVYRARMPKVLNEIRRRGYGIERPSDPLMRVYAALQALDDGEVPDPVSVRLAGAVADLTIVDFLPRELPDIEAHPLATISAPIFAADGTVGMSVSAQPYQRLTPERVREIGAQVVAFAEAARSALMPRMEPASGDPNDRSC